MEYLNGLITIDDDIVSGTPVFTGTRVPVAILLDYIIYGDLLEEFLENYPSVSREQALDFIQKLNAKCKTLITESTHAHTA